MDLQRKLQETMEYNDQLKSEVATLREKNACLEMARDQTKDEPVVTLTTEVAKLKSNLRRSEEQVWELLSKYQQEMAQRKHLFNKLVELNGNIRLLCRVRPPIAEDGTGPQAEVVVETDEHDDGILCVNYRGSQRKFQLSKIFEQSSTQEQIFGEVKDLVTSCIDGFNVTIIAYGQAGSGKTFTMEGKSDNPGINRRALVELFDVVNQRQSDWDDSISVSMIELYNDKVKDLLSETSTELDLRLDGVTKLPVTCVEEVVKIFTLGHDQRSTSATKMNPKSSRSHAISWITVNGVHKATKTVTIGKLNLIDLAGSENAVKSGAGEEQQREAIYINQSLCALSDVIHALNKKASHVPFRNSKLTTLLQDSLRGDSKTLVIVQVSPVLGNVSETISTLSFAQRARGVELQNASSRRVRFETPGSERRPQRKSFLSSTPRRISASKSVQLRFKS